MTESRINFLKSLTNKEKRQLRARDFNKSEMRELINEAYLSETDTDIAVSRYIELKSIDVIASELDVDKKTVLSHLVIIQESIFAVILRISE